MPASPDWPRLGPMSIDPDVLAEPGTSLLELAAELGAAVDREDVDAVPHAGWRVLQVEAQYRLLGAPDAAGRWHLARLDRDQLQLAPAPVAPRRSLTDASRGLALRWPAYLSEPGGVGRGFAVDLVNTGETPWDPEEESVTVIGAFVDGPGEASTFGWLTSSARHAVPLDPGESTRLPIAIADKSWEREPGPVLLRAFVPTLRLAPLPALPLDLSAADIAAHRAQPELPATTRRRSREHAEMLTARLRAADALPALAVAVRESADHDDALRIVAEHLGCDEATASHALQVSLVDSTPDGRERLARQLARAESDAPPPR